MDLSELCAPGLAGLDRIDRRSSLFEGHTAQRTDSASTSQHSAGEALFDRYGERKTIARGDSDDSDRVLQDAGSVPHITISWRGPPLTLVSELVDKCYHLINIFHS